MSGRWFALLLLTVCSAGAQVAGALTPNAELRVDLGGELNGRWLAPQGGTWDGRVVLILHGFASDSEGPGDAQRRLAETLAGRGIASLRLNFSGEGDAKRTDLQATHTSRVADTETALSWILARGGVVPGRVGVLGWSLGGATAISAAARQPDRFRSLALWSSVSGDLHAQLTQGSWSEAATEAARTGEGRLVIEGWKTVTLRREFFESYRDVDVDAELATYPGALLSVRGTGDYLPAAESRWMLAARGRPAEAVLIAGGDHIFNVFAPATPQSDQAIAVTVSWFERTL